MVIRRSAGVTIYQTSSVCGVRCEENQLAHTQQYHDKWHNQTQSCCEYNYLSYIHHGGDAVFSTNVCDLFNIKILIPKVKGLVHKQNIETLTFMSIDSKTVLGTFLIIFHLSFKMATWWSSLCMLWYSLWRHNSIAHISVSWQEMYQGWHIGIGRYEYSPYRQNRYIGIGNHSCRYVSADMQYR